jgi:hypothetical protein
MLRFQLVTIPRVRALVVPGPAGPAGPGGGAANIPIIEEYHATATTTEITTGHDIVPGSLDVRRNGVGIEVIFDHSTNPRLIVFPISIQPGNQITIRYLVTGSGGGSPGPGGSNDASLLTTGILPDARLSANVVKIANLLSAPTTQPLTPSVIWLDAGHVAVSLPAILGSGEWNDHGIFYDSQNWVMS